MNTEDEESASGGSRRDFKNPSAPPSLRESSLISEDSAHLPTAAAGPAQAGQPELFGKSAPVRPTSYEQYLGTTPKPRPHISSDSSTVGRNRLSLWIGIGFIVLLAACHFMSAQSHGNPLFVVGAAFLAIILNTVRNRMKMMPRADLRAAARRKRSPADRLALIIWVPVILGAATILLYFFFLAVTYNIASGFYHDGKFQQAIDTYNFSRIPGLPDDVADVEVGKCYLQMNRNDEAIKIFKRALVVNPNNDYAHMAIGNTYNKMGNYKKAVEEYTKSIAYRPEDYELYSLRADSYEKLGKSNLAKKDRATAKKLEAQIK